MSRRRNKRYSAELKQQAVQEYLNGGGSLREICKKHEIKDKKTLKVWIMWYNGHKEFKERRGATPEMTAENILNREFYAEAPNEKWLTDVTEFKYYIGSETKKLYLSAILDLYDRRIAHPLIIATEVFNIQVKHFTPNLKHTICGKACPESGDALTTDR